MECTSKEENGSFDCDCCLLAALMRCKRQNERAYSLWGKQLKRSKPEQYERIKLMMQGER